jgi:hypothetical protein
MEGSTRRLVDIPSRVPRIPRQGYFVGRQAMFFGSTVMSPLGSRFITRNSPLSIAFVAMKGAV